jgi:small subunit ribosomal protein S13
MFQIFNKTIPTSKSILYSLTKLYGINKYKSNKICKNIGINPQITIDQLQNNHINRLIKYIHKKTIIEQFLRKKKKDHFKSLLEMKLARAIRYTQGLPVRGQRTHTNSKTVRRLSSTKKFQSTRISKRKSPLKKSKPSNKSKKSKK